MRIIIALIMAATALLSGCRGNSGPGEVVREFFHRLQHDRTDGAMELLDHDLREDMLEEFEGKQIISYTIVAVYISEDDCSATVRWNAEIIDEHSPDTNEGNEWGLTRSSDGTWLITDL